MDTYSRFFRRYFPEGFDFEAQEATETTETTHLHNNAKNKQINFLYSGISKQ